MNEKNLKKEKKDLLQESIFMIQPENIFLDHDYNAQKSRENLILNLDSEKEDLKIEHEKFQNEENYDDDYNDDIDNTTDEYFELKNDSTNPTIGNYGNFQGNPFETDYYMNRTLMRQYLEKDEKYPFLSYLNMKFDSLENMNDRISRRVSPFDYEISQNPNEINKDIENNSNMILNQQGVFSQAYSLEQKEKFYDDNFYDDYDDNDDQDFLGEKFQQSKSIEEIKKFIRILDN